MDALLENILRLIDEKGISDLQFQSDLGLYKTAVAEWKNGKSKSYRSHLPKIAEYFNVSADYLLGTEQQELSEIDFALSGELHDLTDAEKQDILDYVRFKKGQRGRKE